MSLSLAEASCDERGYEPRAERRVEGMMAAESPRGEDQLRLVSDERRHDLGEFLRMLAPIAIEEDGDVRVWTERADAGPARRPVAPPRLIDHSRTRAGRNRAGGIGRAVVHHDHLVDHFARHAPQERPDRVGFVEGGMISVAFTGVTVRPGPALSCTRCQFSRARAPPRGPTRA